jgi:phage shock protein A
MFEARIKELELQLATANESLAALTLVNTGLTSQLEDAEVRNRKMKRNSRQAESSFNEKLAVAQSRRG